MSLTTPLAAPAAAPSTPSAAARSDRAGLAHALATPGIWPDAALAVGLALIGLALRLPYLWTIPRFTDETREVLRAVELVNGGLTGLQRLVNVDSYIGGIYIWLLAGAFWLTGVSALTPRLMMAVAGAVAVGFTYLLARDLAGHESKAGRKTGTGRESGQQAGRLNGRFAGLLAAAMLATSGGQILSNAHIAWSHCLTPALTTMAAWLLQRAVRLQCRGSWLASGFVFGLALQSHPAVLVLLPGAALYVLWWGRRWLRTPWPYLALGLFVLAFSPMLIFNVMTGGNSLQEANTVRERYDAGIVVNALVYLGNGLTHDLMLLRYLAGAVDARSGPAAYLLDPTLWIYGGLAVAGLVYAARRGASLLLLMTLSSIIVMPYFNQRKYVPISDGRYLMPLLPYAYAATGLLLATRWQRIAEGGRGLRLGFTFCALLLVLFPLVPLTRYFGQEIAAGRTNTPLLQAVDAVKAAQRPDEPVVLDRNLADIKLEGGGTAFRSLRFLLTGVGIDDRSIDSVSDYAGKMNPGSSALLVTDARGMDSLRPQLDRLGPAGVQAMPVVTPSGPDGYGAYRLERSTSAAQMPIADRPVNASFAPSSATLGRTGMAVYASLNRLPSADAGRAAPGVAGPLALADDPADSRQAAPRASIPVERYASGLVNPRGLAFRADGSLFVALAGNGGPGEYDAGRDKPQHYGRTGQVVRLTQDGGKFLMAKDLPSIVTAVNEECGPSAIAFIGDHTYVLSASGGWDFGDPAYHSGVYELQSDGSLKQIWDMTAHVLAHPALARREDPRADVPAGMAYGMTALDGKLYVTDANQEQLFEVDPNSGEARQVVEYPKSNRAMTGVAAGPDGAVYVAEWASNKITRIGLDGTIQDAATKLRTPVGVTFGPDGAMYVVEFTGRVLRAAPVGQEQKDILVEGLRAPTAITFGPDGNLFVSVHGQGAGQGEGEVVRLRLAPPSPAADQARLVRGVTWGLGLLVFVGMLALGWRFRQRRPV